MKVAVFGEKESFLLELIGFAKQLEAEETYAITLSLTEEGVSKISRAGVKKVYSLATEKATVDDVVVKLHEIVKGLNVDIIAGPATRDGLDISARLGAKLGIPTLTDVFEVEGGTTFKRGIIGGKAVSVEVAEPPVTLTVSLGKFSPPEVAEAEAPIEKVEVEPLGRTRLLEVSEKAKGGIDITASEIVVGVGRGFKSKDDLRLAQELADLLGGAVGCSRPIAADYEWLPEDVWIGFSGKKIRPKLYFTIGISGAAEHMAGARDSKVVVAINNDESAPIFEQADYGVVADLYELLPALLKKIKEKRG
jgi:electron transfer flavoprotein alpha subunit